MLPSTLTAFVMALAWPSIVFGAPLELFTPPVAVAPGETITCSALNVSNRNVQIEVILMDPNGTAAGAATGSGLVAPRVTISLSSQSAPNIVIHYCRVLVDGQISNVRAGATISPGGVFYPAQ
jgi:hypothetical protein